jgi:hypothetical protein
MVVDGIDNRATVESHDANDNLLTLNFLLPQSRNGAILTTSRNLDMAKEIVGRAKDGIMVSTVYHSETIKQNKLELDDTQKS